MTINFNALSLHQPGRDAWNQGPDAWVNWAMTQVKPGMTMPEFQAALGKSALDLDKLNPDVQKQILADPQTYLKGIAGITKSTNGSPAFIGQVRYNGVPEPSFGSDATTAGTGMNGSPSQLTWQPGVGLVRPTGTDANIKKEDAGIVGTVGAVLSVASIIPGPWQPIVAGAASVVNAMNAVATGNIGSLAASVLPFVGQVSGMTNGIVEGVKSGLGVEQATARVLTAAGIGAVAGGATGGLQGAVTGGLAGAASSYAAQGLAGTGAAPTGAETPSGAGQYALDQLYGTPQQPNVLDAGLSQINTATPELGSGMPNLQGYNTPEVGGLSTIPYTNQSASSGNAQGAPVRDATPTPVPPGSNTSQSGLASLVSALTTGSAGGASNLANLAVGAYGAYAAGNQAKDTQALADSMKSADPYYDYIKNSVTPFMQSQQGWANANNQYASDTYGRLQQTYDNPLAVYNTPEMQALSNVFNQGIERRDAAAGRNSQYGARAVEEQNNFLTNSLPQYRTGLNTMYNNLSTTAANQARTAIPGSSGTAGVNQYGTLSNSANDLSNSQYTSLVGPTVNSLQTLFK